MKLSNMASVLRADGLTVVETQGWANRGYAGQDLQEVRGVLWHHTATHRSRFNEDAPTLNMCVHGRSDLPGPLCQIVLGRNGTVYLAAAGVANHAGRGTAPGIPENAGNHYLIGIEMESSGIMPWDWTLDQIRVAPHLGAALERAYLQHLPEDMRLQLGHKEYSYDGKIDPAGWPGDMDGLRGAINRILAGTVTPQSTPEPTKEWYLMPDIPRDNLLQIAAAVNNAKFRQAIRDEVLGAPIVSTDGKKWPLRAHVQGNTKRSVQTLARLEGLEEVVRQLAAGQGVAIDYEKVEQAVKDALAESDVLKAGDVVDVNVNVQGKP